MSRFETRELLPFRPDDLLDLVSDVPAYARFLPWVKAARVSQVRPLDRGRTFIGEAVVGYKAFRTQFSTHVDVDHVARTISTRLINGPFSSLNCVWAFNPTDSGTLVDLTLDFEFSEPFLADLLRANMNKAVSRLMDAFTAEAKRRYALIE
ncbi:ribosome association toxin RatA [Candidatus Phycosocius bacilliformis]|uniref:Ribosome association toxin RatA n=1 Tax=Candidatus Phycosocius bacilliformis TaxID=1445552 RepID=A0A2P2E7Z2_9PROT|nr:type II toxin-antitoxin system RatA family toxin [Candidatus Phycosocius bacilliformis]GBF57157.1 ribosome association toxin RatA [Candidatus Phycosocius bacilliformis]